MNEFSEKWSQIAEEGHAAGRFRMNPDHPLDLFVDYTSNGLRELIVEAHGGALNSPKVPVFQNFDVSVSELASGFRICITLVDPELSQSFSVMCFDLAQRSKRASTVAGSLQIFLNVLNQWAELLKKKLSNGLSRSEVIGLYGELFILNKLLAARVADSNVIIQGWRGPDGDARDIGLNQKRIEVKTQFSTGAIALKISSLEQLNDNKNSIFVALNRISPAELGKSIKNLIEEIESHFDGHSISSSEFERKLELAMYDETAPYAAEKYLIDELIIYKVEGEFPRLTPANVPVGIESASYVIAGTAIARYRIIWEDLMVALNG